jgi:hypothetical protein
MHSIDMFLLNKFQSVSDWFQEWFGVTNFTIARICFVVGIVFTLIIKWIFFVSSKDEGGPFDVFLNIFSISTGVFFILIIWGTLEVIKNEERECLEKPRYVNFLVVHYFWIRIFCLGYLVIIFIPSSRGIELNDFFAVMAGIFTRLEVLTFSVAFYFASCTPKPHKPNKAKKWLKSFVEFVQATVAGVFSPAPELATIPVAKNLRVTQRPILGKGSVIFLW